MRAAAIVERSLRTPTGPRSAKLRTVFILGGRIVDIHEVVEKASGHVARCSLDGEEVPRLLELPTLLSMA